MLAFRPRAVAVGVSPHIHFLRVEEQLPEISFGLATLRSAKTSRSLEVFLDLVRALAPTWSSGRSMQLFNQPGLLLS